MMIEINENGEKHHNMMSVGIRYKNDKQKKWKNHNIIINANVTTKMTTTLMHHQGRVTHSTLSVCPSLPYRQHACTSK